MFATRLKKLRVEKDITQAEFAKIIGVAQQTVGSWEKGKSTPSYDLLNKIADYFDVSADYLLGRNVNNSTSLSDEQKKMLKTFESLKTDAQSTILTMLDSLKVTHSAAV